MLKGEASNTSFILLCVIGITFVWLLQTLSFSIRQYFVVHFQCLLVRFINCICDCECAFYCLWRSRGVRDRMVVGFTTTCAISEYHHYKHNVRTRSWWGVLVTTLCDKVCHWLAAGRWFSPGTPVSSTNKTDRHDITERLLKMALNTITLSVTPIAYGNVCLIVCEQNVVYTKEVIKSHKTKKDRQYNGTKKRAK